MKEIERILKVNDIHELAEEVSNVLQKAIVIENHQFELIAYSTPSSFSFDPIQQKTILTKRCPLYVIERLRKDGILSRLQSESAPIRISQMEDIDFHQRIVLSLKIHEKVYGYLWLYETDELTESELALLDSISSHLAESLYQQEYTKEDSSQTFLWKVLNGEFLNEAEIAQSAKMVNFKVPAMFAVIVFSVNDTAYYGTLEKISTKLKEAHIPYYFGKGTEIIAIVESHHRFPDDKVEASFRAIYEAVEPAAKKAINVGIGNVYDQISYIRKSYVEALEVIETMVFLNIVKQEKYYFKDLGLYRYTKMAYKKNMFEAYRHPLLLELMQKDRENKSELLKTLWYFLQYDCKVAKTADALFIHPNTMNYRMKQITSLVAIDFSNMELKTELYLELLLLHQLPDYFNFYASQLVDYSLSSNE